MAFSEFESDGITCEMLRYRSSSSCVSPARVVNSEFESDGPSLSDAEIQTKLWLYLDGRHVHSEIRF